MGELKKVNGPIAAMAGVTGTVWFIRERQLMTYTTSGGAVAEKKVFFEIPRAMVTDDTYLYVADATRIMRVTIADLTTTVLAQYDRDVLSLCFISTTLYVGFASGMLFSV